MVARTRVNRLGRGWRGGEKRGILSGGERHYENNVPREESREGNRQSTGLIIVWTWGTFNSSAKKGKWEGTWGAGKRFTSYETEVNKKLTKKKKKTHG